jgi:DNA mismatch endonuclease (patch repair protein)
MADIVNRETRSRMMAGIKGKNTAPEMLVRRFLHKQGFRYRLHNSTLPGSPDLTFRQYRAVVFVNGCFWHRHHECPLASVPKSNQEKWLAKFAQNIERDKQNVELLVQSSWRVITVWECELRSHSSQVLFWLSGEIKRTGGASIAEYPSCG